jgi:hypothetical protein
MGRNIMLLYYIVSFFLIGYMSYLDRKVQISEWSLLSSSVIVRSIPVVCEVRGHVQGDAGHPGR